MIKKYVCFAGEIKSRDGDTHHIPARRVPELYKVDPRECCFVEKETDLTGSEVKRMEGKIFLSPKEDGSYYDAKEVQI